MTVRALARLATAALILASQSGVVAAQTADEAVLLRCREHSSAPCLVTTVGLDATAARRLLGAEPEALLAGWRAKFLGDTGLVARAERGIGDAGRPIRLFILVDVSGSMKYNLGIGTARLVLRQFLDTLGALPAEKVRVAVAPFGSVQVAPRIAAARFTTPDSAQAQVSQLPDPERENTGLYSAVELGARRVLEELKRSAPEGLGALVVITDGNNDVRNPGDDPGLLDGQAGLDVATRAINQDQLVPWIIGLQGDKGAPLNEAALTTLAGPRGRKYLVRVDAYELAKPLGEIRSLLWSSWEVAVPLAGTARQDLARGWTTLVPRITVGSVSVTSTPAAFRPPVVALPAFAGVVPASLSPLGSGGGRSSESFLYDRRVPLGLMLAVSLVLLWLVVPRVVWPPLAVQAAPAGAAKAPKPEHAPGGLRTDVKEVAPRRPSDVTASKAKRV